VVETDRFRLVGVTWTAHQGTAPPDVLVRVRSGGQWTGWTSLAPMDSGPDAGTLDAERGVRAATEPLWTARADAVDVSLRGGGGAPVPADARIELVDPGVSPADRTLGRPGVLDDGSTATAAPGPPPIIPRAAWGADEGLRLGQCPEGPAYAPTVKVGFVHHTVTSNSYGPGDSAAIIRGIYAFHVNGRGWCDIAYNFLVDRYGQIFEGRFGGVDWPVIGGHTGGFNTESFGVAMIGTFSSQAPPPATAAGVQHVLAWKLGAAYWSPHGVDYLLSRCVENCRYAPGTLVPFNAIAGHTDATLTSCPGAAAYAQLPGLRNGAAAMVGPLPRPAIDFWEPLGGVVRGAPAGVWRGPGRYDVFATGVDFQLWHRWWQSNTGWSGWVPLGGYLTSSPTVSTWGPGRIDVLGRGGDGGLYHKVFERGGWSGWELLGGDVVDAPAGVWSGAGNYHIFATSSRAQLWHRSWRLGTGWSPWQLLGGVLTSSPAVSSWGPGRIDVVVRGVDTAVWHLVYDGGWSGWEPLGGSIVDAPAGTSWGWGRYDVVARGIDGQLWHRGWEWTSGWSGWEPFGGVITSSPSLSTVWGPNRLDTVARGLDLAAWHRVHQR
jgi:hypothetical protein